MKKRIVAFMLILSLLAMTGCMKSGEKEKVKLTWYMLTEDVNLYNGLKELNPDILVQDKPAATPTPTPTATAE